MIPEEADFFLSSYRFDLPPEQIAQFPPEERGASRLLVMPRKGAPDPCPELRHAMFSELPDLLPPGALIVANNSRVLQARLLGSRFTGGKVEFLLLTPLPLVMERASPDKAGGADAFSAEAEGLVRCGGSVREGETFAFGAGIRVTVLESGPFGKRRVRLAWRGDLAKAFAATGHIPLPPYIKRADGEEDLSRYQTVYARDDKTGSVAAPTAGLHFTPALRERLAARGFEWAEVTLYVGYGTFAATACTVNMWRCLRPPPKPWPEPRPRAVPCWLWALPACGPWRAWPNSAAGCSPTRAGRTFFSIPAGVFAWWTPC